jgi:hypothetical protein
LFGCVGAGFAAAGVAFIDGSVTIVIFAIA